MVGKEYLNKFHPKPSFVRRQVGYIALLIGCVVAKIVVRGKWHLPKKKGFIIASNHFSILDPPFFKYAIQKFMTKTGAKGPQRYFFNAIARSLGGVPLGAMEKYARRKSPEHERVIETIKAKYW